MARKSKVKHPGRPTIDPKGNTEYVVIGKVAMIDEQIAFLEALADEVGGKAAAIRWLIESAKQADDERGAA